MCVGVGSGGAAGRPAAETGAVEPSLTSVAINPCATAGTASAVLVLGKLGNVARSGAGTDCWGGKEGVLAAACTVADTSGVGKGTLAATGAGCEGGATDASCAAGMARGGTAEDTGSSGSRTAVAEGGSTGAGAASGAPCTTVAGCTGVWKQVLQTPAPEHQDTRGGTGGQQRQELVAEGAQAEPLTAAQAVWL